MGKVGGDPLGGLPYTTIYEALRRRRARAPTPEATSTRLAARVTGSISEGPPLLGSAVAVAVAVDVAVALPVALEVAVDVEVEVAVDMAVWWSARATGANSRTITVVALNSNSIFFT